MKQVIGTILKVGYWTYKDNLVFTVSVRGMECYIELVCRAQEVIKWARQFKEGHEVIVQYEIVDGVNEVRTINEYVARKEVPMQPTPLMSKEVYQVIGRIVSSPIENPNFNYLVIEVRGLSRIVKVYVGDMRESVMSFELWKAVVVQYQRKQVNGKVENVLKSISAFYGHADIIKDEVKVKHVVGEVVRIGESYYPAEVTYPNTFILTHGKGIDKVDLILCVPESLLDKLSELKVGQVMSVAYEDRGAGNWHKCIKIDLMLCSIDPKEPIVNDSSNSVEWDVFEPAASIEPPHYIVVVGDKVKSETKFVKHSDINVAEAEAHRLSAKENATAIVYQSISKVDQVPSVSRFDVKKSD
jgi:hypothetical protein